MSQLRTDFASSAPSSSKGRPGPTFLPSKPSSSHSSTGRRSQHRIPPLGKQKGDAAAPAAARPSMITQQQRDALHVSAFGFSTQPTSSSIAGGGGTFADGSHYPSSHPQRSTGGKRSAALARSLHTTCSNDSDIVVTLPEKNSARFHLCVQALAEGCVQSFSHLFYLSHRDSVCVDVLSQRHFAIPEDKLRWVQENLSSIEVLRRQSEFSEVMARCHAVADYFENEFDVEEADYHHDAALRYAMESLEYPLEYEARHEYARFLQRHKLHAAAADMYESMRSLTIAMKDDAKVLEVNLALVQAYRTLGDQITAEGGDSAAAKRCYEKSVRYAQRGNASTHEGEGYDALGKMHERSGQLGKALLYQQSYRQLSHSHGLPSHECRAALNVAGLEEQLGRSADATASLHDALRLAKGLGDAEKVCRATMQLGEVYRAEGDAEAAMTCFREAFPSAFESGRQELIDSVRVAMGFAAGEFYFANAGGGQGYLPIVCDDVRAQLAWMSNGEL